MHALVYNGPLDVSVADVPDATIEAPTDVVIRITATNICGSDLHMYEGRTDVEQGKVLGHENLGEVIEVGDGVVSLTVGDRVVLPFNIGCGFCRNCQAGSTGFWLTVNPGNAGGAYGYAGMGPYNGGQAELLRADQGGAPDRRHRRGRRLRPRGPAGRRRAGEAGADRLRHVPEMAVQGDDAFGRLLRGADEHRASRRGVEVVGGTRGRREPAAAADDRHGLVPLAPPGVAGRRRR